MFVVLLCVDQHHSLCLTHLSSPMFVMCSHDAVKIEWWPWNCWMTVHGQVGLSDFCTWSSPDYSCAMRFSGVMFQPRLPWKLSGDHEIVGRLFMVKLAFCTWSSRAWTRRMPSTVQPPPPWRLSGDHEIVGCWMTVYGPVDLSGFCTWSSRAWILPRPPWKLSGYHEIVGCWMTVRGFDVQVGLSGFCTWSSPGYCCAMRFSGVKVQPQPPWKLGGDHENVGLLLMFKLTCYMVLRESRKRFFQLSTEFLNNIYSANLHPLCS